MPFVWDAGESVCVEPQKYAARIEVSVRNGTGKTVINLWRCIFMTAGKTARTFRSRRNACDECLCDTCGRKTGRNNCRNCHTCVYVTFDMDDPDNIKTECRRYKKEN